MIILNTKIKTGKTILHLEIAKLHTGTPIDVPIIIQRSKVKGPTLLLIAGIHGDEVNGVEIVRQIIRKRLNIPDAGTTICIPVVNVFGFLNQEREFPDGRDLNRVFPGNKKGSLASRFAHKIMQEIVPHIDYAIDFHTGGDERFNYPQIRVDASHKEALELAKVFGSRFILNAPQRSKTFRKSLSDLNKTMLLFEGGKTLDLDRKVTEQAIQGTQRVLHHLGMKTFSETTIPQDQHILDGTAWIRASRSGMYRSVADLGSYVHKGQVLGSISDPYGIKEKNVKAPKEGFIICSNHAPIVNQGDALFHISSSS